MQSIIVIFLLVLAITIFSISSVNGASTKPTQKVTNTTLFHKSSTASSHGASSRRLTSAGTTRSSRSTPSTSHHSTNAGTTHSSRSTSSTSHHSTPKPVKTSPSSTSKTTTVNGKKPAATSTRRNLKKRLSPWNWD